MSHCHFLIAAIIIAFTACCSAVEIRVNDQAGQLEIRPAGEHSIRVTLKPVQFQPDFPFTPALLAREYGPPVIGLRHFEERVAATLGICASRSYPGC